MLDQYTHLIGKKYDYEGGDRINSFNCATLVEHVLKMNLCGLDYDIKDIKSSIKAIALSKEAYKKIDVPLNGAIVTLGKKSLPHHVGVYMDGYIMHADRKLGVVLADKRNLKKNGFWNIEYWIKK